MKFKNLKYVTSFILIALMLSFASLAEALTFDSRSVFESQYSSSIPPITFEGIGLGIVDTQYSGSGITFEGGETNFFSQQALFAYESPGIPASITGIFTVNVNFIGFDFQSSSPLTLLAYNSSGVILESIASSSSSGFLGVATGNENSAYFVVHDSGHNFAIDNVLFGSTEAASTIIPQVPEAGTLILLGGGLLGLGVCRKKLKL